MFLEQGKNLVDRLAKSEWGEAYRAVFRVRSFNAYAQDAPALVKAMESAWKDRELIQDDILYARHEEVRGRLEGCLGANGRELDALAAKVYTMLGIGGAA